MSQTKQSFGNHLLQCSTVLTVLKLNTLARSECNQAYLLFCFKEAKLDELRTTLDSRLEQIFTQLRQNVQKM